MRNTPFIPFFFHTDLFYSPWAFLDSCKVWTTFFFSFHIFVLSFVEDGHFSEPDLSFVTRENVFCLFFSSSLLCFHRDMRFYIPRALGYRRIYHTMRERSGGGGGGGGGKSGNVELSCVFGVCG